MQIQLFRPKKRETWIAQLRQNGWHVQVFYHPHKVTVQGKPLLMDSAAGHWEKYAAGFVQKGCKVFLLVDEEEVLKAEELESFGVSGVISPDEEGMIRLSEIVKEESGREEVPLSQRIKPKPVDCSETQEGMNQDTPEVDVSTLVEAPISHLQERQNGGMKILKSLPSMIAVYGAKGGVGKTVFILNLAALLSQHQVKVCVVDLDLYQGTVASTLHIHPELTITDLVRRIDDHKALSACLLESEMGFSIVAAPSSYMDISGITTESLNASLQILKQQFDVVLIDTSTFFDDAVKAALEQADHVLLMTTDEPASVKNLRKMTALLSGVCTEKKTRLIQNRVTGTGIQSQELQEYVSWLHDDLILEHVEVSDFAKRGLCLSISDADHPYSKQLEHWVRGWLNKEPSRPINWRQRVLDRLSTWKGGE